MTGAEYKVHLAVIKWLLLQYPNVQFRSDLAGLRMPIGLAIKASKINGNRKSWPDLFIAEMRCGNGGMYIEIKATRDDLYKKCGGMRNNQHIKDQAEMLNKLRDLGYHAVFCCGIDECISKIKSYIAN